MDDVMKEVMRNSQRENANRMLKEATKNKDKSQVEKSKELIEKQVQDIDKMRGNRITENNLRTIKQDFKEISKTYKIEKEADICFLVNTHPKAGIMKYSGQGEDIKVSTWYDSFLIKE